LAQHIGGPLYYERMGRTGPVMAFIHPNPMDQSCWIFQMAHLSTWYRCIAIDIPGYGRSPAADDGLTVGDMAAGCWEAIDEIGADEAAILVGCSVGASIVPYMYHQRPARTAAMVLTGTGYNPSRDFATKRIENFTDRGIGYRWDFTLEDLSPAFRATPLAHFFAEMFVARNGSADLATILRVFEALKQPDADDFHSSIDCPTVILTGSEDTAHAGAFALKKRIPGCELRVLPGAGHACHIEQPWLFDRNMIDFLTNYGLFQGSMSLQTR
jgi:pimeloyl-ACP methyl ester carboxylesterase